MLSAKAFRNDLPFFGTAGALCGLMQWLGHQFDNKFEWGTALFQELPAFQILMLSCIFLLAAKSLIRLRGTAGIHAWLQTCITHVSRRAISLASVGATAYVGLSLAATMTGAFREAIIFLGASVYLLALGELAANPFFGPNRSKTYDLAFAIMAGTPFGVSLAE